MVRGPAAIGGLALTATLLSGSVAEAATRTVDTVSDDAGKNACTATPDDCSLRGALGGAAGGDTIVFASELSGDIVLGAALVPPLSVDLTISGPGAAELAISGGDANRVFEVDSGSTLRVEDVTIRDGSSPFNGGCATVSSGRLELVRSVVTSCEAISGNGGAVYVNGTGALLADQTLISDNVANVFGGALTNFYGEMAVINSTISGNQAAYGGAIFHYSENATTISGSTIAGNAASHGGGGIYNMDYASGGGIRLLGTVVADNTANGLADDVQSGPDSPTHSAFSLIETAGIAITDDGGTFPEGTDPQLGALADNGGPTLTMAPAATSPLVDAGGAFGLTVDQRGLPRPYDVLDIANAFDDSPTYHPDASDIGAVELQAGVFNAAPAATDDAETTSEDTALTRGAASGVLANDTDPDGDGLTVTEVAGSGTAVGSAHSTTKGASITLDADGSFTYDPSGSTTLARLAAGESTTDAVSYTVSDGQATATATLTVTVTGEDPVVRPGLAWGAHTVNFPISTTTITGAPGDLPSLDAMHGVAVDENGNVFLGPDASNHAIVQVDAQNAYVRTLTVGTACDQPAEPYYGLDAAGGFLYVADHCNDLLRKFSIATGLEITDGPWPVPAIDAYDVVTDGTSIWVAQHPSHSVQKFGVDGTGDDAFEPTTTGWSSATGLGLDRHGHLLVSDATADDVRVLNADTGTLLDTYELPAGTMPYGVDMDDAGTLWVVAGRAVGAQAQRYDVSSGTPVLIGGYGGLTNPRFQDIGPDGAVHIANYSGGYVSRRSAPGQTVVEQAGPVAIDDALRLDADRPITNAQIEMTAGHVAGQDRLVYSGGPAGVVANSATQTSLDLRAPGGATLAEWRDALRHVAIEVDGDDPTDADRTVTLVVGDGIEASNVLSKRVVVIPEDDPPTAQDDSYSTDEDTALEVPAAGVLSNDTDVDTAALAVAEWGLTSDARSADNLGQVLPFGAGDANVTLAADGTLGLDPDGAFEGLGTGESVTRTISYRATDATTPSATGATVTMEITGVNDAPVVTTTATPAVYTEGDGEVAVDAGVTVTDADSDELSSATVRIDPSATFEPGQDVLAFVNDSPLLHGDIAGSYDAETGVLTLSSALGATPAQWQAALASVTYENTSQAPNTLDRRLRFSVSDGSATSAEADRIVALIASNDAPEVTTSGAGAAFTEDGGPVAVDAGIAISDVDSEWMASATLTISPETRQDGADVLAFVNDDPDAYGNITGSFADGTLTLTSQDQLATMDQWRAALGAVTFDNDSDAPSTTTRVVTVTLTDGVSPSADATTTITVAGTNDPPAQGGAVAVLAPDRSALTIPRDAAATAVRLEPATLSDPDGTTVDELRIASVTGGTVTTGEGAPITVGAAGTRIPLSTVAGHRGADLRFTPAAGRTADAVIAYAVVDPDDPGVNSDASDATVDLYGPPVTGTPTVAGPLRAGQPLTATASATGEGPFTFAYQWERCTGDPSVCTPVDGATGQTHRPTSGSAGARYRVEVVASNAAGAGAAVTSAETAARTPGANGVIAYRSSSGGTDGIRSVDEDGTGGRQITAAGSYPAWSPDGTRLVYTASDNELRVVDADGTDDTALGIDGFVPRWSPDGTQLAYTREGKIWVANADGTGERQLTAPSVGFDEGADWSPDGTQIVFRSSRVAPAAQLFVIASSATAESEPVRRITAGTTDVGFPRWSPDGSRVAFSVRRGSPLEESIWTVDPATTAGASDAAVEVASAADPAAPESSPAWSADGTKLLFVRVVGGWPKLFVGTADGPGPAQQVMAASSDAHAVPDWQPAMGPTAGTVAIDDATPALGQTITASGSGETGTPVLDVAYAWQRCDENGANCSAAGSGATHAVTAADIGSRLRVTRTVSNGAGSAAVSALTTAIDSVAVDLDVANTPGHAARIVGQSTTWTVAVGNEGTADVPGADVSIPVPAGVSGVTWTCAAGPGSDCGTASGSGAVSGTIALIAAGESATYSVSGTIDSGTGTLSHTATVTPPDGYVDADGGLSATASTTLSNRPVVTLPPTTDVPYTEQGTAVAIAGDLTVADADGGNLSGATVTIGSGRGTGDVLSVSAGALTAEYTADTGTLAISGSASIATYQSVLRTVAFANGLDDPSSATRTVSITVTDGTLTSVARTRDVEFTTVDDAPVAGDDEFSTGEDSVLTVAAPGVLADDTDAEDDALSVSAVAGQAADVGEVVTTGEGAEVTIAAGGAVSYDPNGQFESLDSGESATDSVTYEVTGGNGSDTATVTFTITGANDAPTVSTAPGAVAYTENDPLTAVDPALDLADVDEEPIESATVVVGMGHGTGDVLGLTSAVDGITAAWDADTWTLTLTGPASAADFRTALRRVGFRNTLDNPSGADRTVTFTVDDGDDTASASRGVDFTTVNDAPVVTPTADPLPYTDGQGPVPVDAGVTLTDPDDADLVGATVQITANLGPDVLAYADGDGITGSWNAAQGLLTLSGAASVADYQAALRRVSYRLDASGPAPNRTVTFTASDASGAGPPATRTVATGLNLPVSTALPSVTGRARLGHDLTATDGTWTGSAPISRSVRWQRCDAAGSGCTDIPSATGATHHVSAADVGARLRAVVSATNAAGGPVEAASAATAIVRATLAAPTFTQQPAALSSDGAPALAFAGEEGAAFECSVDGAPFAPCPSPLALSGLADGPHSVAVRQTHDGLTSEAATASWTVDRTPPPVPSIALVDGVVQISIGEGTSPTDAASGTLECRIDDGAWTPCSSPFTPSLAPGTHAVAARFTDAAGNRSSAEVTIVVEADAVRGEPGAVLAAGSGSSGDGAAASITILGDSLQVACMLSSGDMTACSVKVYLGGSGARAAARRTLIARGQATAPREPVQQMPVQVVLTRRGKRLLDRRGSLNLAFDFTIRGPEGTAPERVTRQATVSLVKRVFVLFGGDSSRLTPAVARYVRQVGRALRRSAVRVTCVGHADGAGSASYAHRVGLRRARATCAALRAAGVRAELSATSMGSRRPRAANTTARGRALNRRVEVVIRYR